MTSPRRALLPLLILLLPATLPPAGNAAPGAAPAEVDSLLEAAVIASRSDDHGTAIAAYRGALALSPRRVEEISGPLAFQYAWAGRLGEARAEFVRATALAPSDRDLRLGELLVTNWMGRHLEAWEGYELLHRTDRTDPAPVLGMAVAQNWAGRQDLALESLRRVRILAPSDRDAARLESSIRGDLRPVAGAYHDYASDSDDYRVNGFWGDVTFAPHPQWRITPFVNRLGIRRPGSPPIDEDWGGLRVSARPWTRIAIRSRLSLLVDSSSGEEGLATGTAGVEFTLGDALRLSLEGERFAVVSYTTYPDRITGESFGGALEAAPDWLTRIRFSLDHGTYSDDNARWNAWLTGSRQVWAPVRLRTGFTARWLDFDRWIDNGIWTPEDFRALAGTLAFEAGPRDAWAIVGGCELGTAREGTGEAALHAGYWLGFHRTLGPWVLVGRIGHSEGNVETGTGYDRSYTHLGLRARF